MAVTLSLELGQVAVFVELDRRLGLEVIRVDGTWLLEDLLVELADIPSLKHVVIEIELLVTEVLVIWVLQLGLIVDFHE